MSSFFLVVWNWFPIYVSISCIYLIVFIIYLILFLFFLLLLHGWCADIFYLFVFIDQDNIVCSKLSPWVLYTVCNKCELKHFIKKKNRSVHRQWLTCVCSLSLFICFLREMTFFLVDHVSRFQLLVRSLNIMNKIAGLFFCWTIYCFWSTFPLLLNIVCC